MQSILKCAVYNYTGITVVFNIFYSSLLNNVCMLHYINNNYN